MVGAGVLVAGSLLGAQLGTWLLRRLPERVLPWTLIGFVALVIITQQLRVPVRQAALELDPARVVALVGVGVVAGVLSGLVGVGGGSVIVPGLELVVGVGDLLARGTSLLVMIPTGIAGTVSNARHHMVDRRTSLLVGVAAVAAAPLGVSSAAALSPAAGNVAFSLFLLAVVVHTLVRSRRCVRASQQG